MKYEIIESANYYIIDRNFKEIDKLICINEKSPSYLSILSDTLKKQSWEFIEKENYAKLIAIVSKDANSFLSENNIYESLELIIETLTKQENVSASVSLVDNQIKIGVVRFGDTYDSIKKYLPDII